MKMELAILSVVLFSIFSLVTSQPTTVVPDFDLAYCLYNAAGNYTNGSDYQLNLNHVLSTPAGDGNGYGFYSLSYGGDGVLGDVDKVHAIGQCRGDLKQPVCRDCLKNATIRILQVCPGQKDAGGWYQYCMLRYSNRSMAGGAVARPTELFEHSSQNASDRESFNRDLLELLTGLKDRAAGGGDLRKFATGSTSTPEFMTIYALVQCTADMSEQSCKNCLDNAIGDIPRCCDGKTGGRVIQSNCNFRYETYVFYEQVDDAPLSASPPAPPATASPPPPTSMSQGSGSNKSRTILIGVSSAVGTMMLAILVFVCLRIRKKNKKTDRPYEPVEETKILESLQYSFETIRVATDNFSDSNKLGQGDFGAMYKGRLSNGNFIAVKKLSMSSKKGDLEFEKEVTRVARLQHSNLVRLLGFCLEGSERLLVYELVQNGSLDCILFDQTKRANLDWDKRYKIIGGVARGLLYLHKDSRRRTIHRDIKASNILLDEEMNPKIADLGMEKLFMVDQTQDNDTRRIRGTSGLWTHKHYSMMSDVFSFGVLLLEIVSGHKNIYFRCGDQVEDLLMSVWKNRFDGTMSIIVDPMIRQGPRSQITRCIHIALLCVQENIANRPMMNTIVRMLNTNSVSLPMPSEPAFYMHNNTVGSNFSEDFNSGEIESDDNAFVQPS